MKGLFFAVVLMVVGAQSHADSRNHSSDLGPKVIREYK